VAAQVALAMTLGIGAPAVAAVVVAKRD